MVADQWQFEKGYSATMILPKYNGYYGVSVNNNKVKKVATSMLNPIKNVINDAYVLPWIGEMEPMSRGDYHLIGNSFGEEENTERYVKEMKEKGYPEATVLGCFDGRYMVSIKTYHSREAATNGCVSVSADAGSAWVF